MSDAAPPPWVKALAHLDARGRSDSGTWRVLVGLWGWGPFRDAEGAPLAFAPRVTASAATIAAKLGMKKAAVAKQLRKLAAEGWIHRTPLGSMALAAWGVPHVFDLGDIEPGGTWAAPTLTPQDPQAESHRTRSPQDPEPTGSPPLTPQDPTLTPQGQGVPPQGYQSCSSCSSSSEIFHPARESEDAQSAEYTNHEHGDHAHAHHAHDPNHRPPAREPAREVRREQAAPGAGPERRAAAQTAQPGEGDAAGEASATDPGKLTSTGLPPPPPLQPHRPLTTGKPAATGPSSRPSPPGQPGLFGDDPAPKRDHVADLRKLHESLSVAAYAQHGLKSKNNRVLGKLPAPSTRQGREIAGRIRDAIKTHGAETCADMIRWRAEVWRRDREELARPPSQAWSPKAVAFVVGKLDAGIKPSAKTPQRTQGSGGGGHGAFDRWRDP